MHNPEPIVIPGLPAHLREMPPEITGPYDPLREEKVAAWFDWAQQVYDYRIYRWAACEGLIPGLNPEKEIEIELIRCRESPLYLATIYLFVYETDPHKLKKFPWHRPEHGGWLPAIPFHYMARLFHWLDDRLEGKNDIFTGAIPKPRRMGISDACVNWALAHWLVDPVFSAKFISRKLDLVYDKDNMDALLQRAIAKLDDAPGNAPIPSWLLPKGWSVERNVSEPLVSRPDNKNLLSGEATTGTAGRGGRATSGFIDEAAVMGKTLNRIIGAIQATCSMVIVVSSETDEEGEEFIELVRKGLEEQPESIFEVFWWQHPLQDQEWLAKEEQRYIDQNNHAAFFREILREPYAMQEGWMYPDARLMSVENEYIDARDRDSAYIEVAIDPGWRDETALHWMLIDPVAGEEIVLESYEASGYPPEYYAAIIAGVDPDQYPMFRFSPAAVDLLQWVASLNEAGKRPKRICGDPAGSASHGGTDPRTGRDDSWYARMVDFWHDEGIEPIPIVFNWKMKGGRELQERRIAVMAWLRSGRAKFNNTPQVRRTLWAIAHSKWDDPDRRITEQKDVVHDEKSHRRSALEYWVVNHQEVEWTEVGRPDVNTMKKRNLEDFFKKKNEDEEKVA